jgi:hypothetical protein
LSTDQVVDIEYIFLLIVENSMDFLSEYITLTFQDISSFQVVLIEEEKKKIKKEENEEENK